MKDPKSSAYYCDVCAHTGKRVSAILMFHPEHPDLCEAHVKIAIREIIEAPFRALSALISETPAEHHSGTIH